MQRDIKSTSQFLKEFATGLPLIRLKQRNIAWVSVQTSSELSLRYIRKSSRNAYGFSVVHLVPKLVLSLPETDNG